MQNLKNSKLNKREINNAINSGHYVSTFGHNQTTDSLQSLKFYLHNSRYIEETSTVDYFILGSILAFKLHLQISFH